MSSTYDQVEGILDQAADNKEQQYTQSYDNDVNTAAQDAEHPFKAAESGYDDVKNEMEKPFEEVGQGYDEAKNYVDEGYEGMKGDVEKPFRSAEQDGQRYEQDAEGAKDGYERGLAGDLEEDARN